MLSYRHAYHAGNHADVLKHLILVHCLGHMNAKDKPYLVFDTHAGAGLYGLDADAARKTGEYAEGIGRLWSRDDLPPGLDDYLCLLRALNGGSRLQRYPGSPWFALRLTRETDSLRLCELHSTDFALLRREFGADGKRLRVERADGFEALKSALPPPSRRGLILIDPSYEVKADYLRLTTVLKDALKRFATGMFLVWHPALPSIEARQLPERLKKLGATNWLHATLDVRAPSGDGRGMHGSGMFLINPPWTLAAMLEETLPYLARVLAVDDRSAWSLRQATEPAP